VEVVKVGSDPLAGVVRQVGSPVAFRDSWLTELPLHADPAEASYAALYRREKVFGWLKALTIAKVVVKRRGRNRCQR